MEDLVINIIGHLHYAGLFGLLVLGGLGLPVPEDLILLASGFLISTGALEPGYALPAVYTGMLVSDFMLFNIGKRYGRSALRHGRLGRLLPPGRLAALEERFNKRGALVIFAGRHFVGLRAQIFLAAGIMGMPAARFLLADALSAIITIAVMVGLGFRGGQGFQALMQDVTRIRHLAVVVAVSVLAVYLLYIYIRHIHGAHRGNGTEA